jgi:hypothetical protein
MFAPPTREVVILEPDNGAGFAVLLGDVARRSKMSWEMGAAHGAFERPWTRSFKTKAASFTIVAAPMMRVPCALLG